MLIRLWGTRGSIPANGVRFSRYGEMTSCIEVRTDENDVLILDAGTGIRDLGKSLMPEIGSGAIRSLHLLLSHWHLDHIQGLPFFAPIYNPDSGLIIHGALAKENLDLNTALGRLFDGLQFPLQWKAVPRHTLHDFTAGDELHLGSACVTTCPTCHPGGCTAFRITADGWSFAFTGDHEIPLDEREDISRTAATDRLFSFLAGSDVVLADAHFTEHDHQAHPGWGHSDFAQWPKPLAERGVRHLIYTHYCPDYTDRDIDRSLAELHASYDGLPMTIQAGQQGASIDREGLVDEGGNEAEHCEICDFLPYLSGHAESHTMLTTILRQARDFTGADAGTIYLRSGDELIFAASQNDTLFPYSQASKAVYLNSRIPLNKDSIAGYVACTGKTLNIADVYCMPANIPFSFNPSYDKKTGYRTQSVLAMPLRDGDAASKVIGVIQLINSTRDGRTVPFAPAMESLIARLGIITNISLQRAATIYETIERILLAGNMHDPKETGMHVLRVGSVAAELYHKWAEKHGVDPEDMLVAKGQLRLAAMLHDVGKLGIPDSVLKKPGRLTEDEYHIMQRHTALGASLFAAGHHEIDRMVHDISLHHHARWDGKGYTGDPNIPSPAGEAIPLCARITAVADVYDALVSKRSYKEAWGPEKALGILKEEAGTHFDPEIVECLEEIQDITAAIYDCYQDDNGKDVAEDEAARYLV